MRKNKSYNPDAFDQFAQLIAISLFCMALNLFGEAIIYLVNEETSHILYTFSHAAQFLQTVFLVMAFLRLGVGKSRTISSYKQGFLDSYVVDSVKRAAMIACFMTLMVLAVLDIVTNTTMLPADFFIKIPSITLLAVFSLSFFFLNRDSSDNKLEQEFGV